MLSDIAHGLFKRLAVSVVRKRYGAFRRISEVEEHDDLFIFRKIQIFRESVRIKAVEPAAVDACVVRCKRKMRRDDGGILCA